MFALKIFTVLNILFTFRIFEQLALALKNRVCLEFTYWKHIFIIQDFWTTCSCAGKQSCPEIFHCFEILKYFLLFRNFEQLALALKTKFALNFFTGLKYFLSFKNFEQFAHALKTEFALKFFKPRDGSIPRPPASYAYGIEDENTIFYIAWRMTISKRYE